MLEVKTKVNLNPAATSLRRWFRLIEGDLVRRVGTRIRVQVRTRIRKEKTSPDGGSWPARTSGGSWPLLVKTGRMISEIQYRRTDKTSGRVHVPTEYARFVNAKRRFMGLSTSNVDNIDKLIDSWRARKLT